MFAPTPRGGFAGIPSVRHPPRWASSALRLEDVCNLSEEAVIVNTGSQRPALHSLKAGMWQNGGRCLDVAFALERLLRPT